MPDKLFAQEINGLIFEFTRAPSLDTVYYNIKVTEDGVLHSFTMKQCSYGWQLLASGIHPQFIKNMEAELNAVLVEHERSV